MKCNHDVIIFCVIGDSSIIESLIEIIFWSGSSCLKCLMTEAEIFKLKQVYLHLLVLMDNPNLFNSLKGRERSSKTI